MNKDKIEIIANWLLTIGYNNTMSGNYIVDFETVAEYFEEPLDEIIKHKDDIKDIIDASELILSETWLDDNEFNMMFCVDPEDE